MTWIPAPPEVVLVAKTVTGWLQQFPGAGDGVLPDATALAAQYADPAALAIAQGVVRWIVAARAAGYPSGLASNPGWFPASSDYIKSALWERIRSGKEPLAEPPPRGMACPWYALVEDPGPHYVNEVMELADDHWLRDLGDGGRDERPLITALQNIYEIVERVNEKDFVVRDAAHQPTSYRFRLWYDPDYTQHGWTMPGHEPLRGGWLLCNVALMLPKA